MMPSYHAVRTITSCLADKAKLEDGAGLLRSRAHTEYAAERFELGELWDEYGIVGDIVV